MINRRGYLVSCVVLLLLAMAPTAPAGSSEEALEILEKVKTIAGKPFRTDYGANMEVEQMGAKMTVKMTGEITQGGEKLQRNKVSMSMEGIPGMPGPMEMDMLSVIDGETIWVDMTHPMMGRQVMKIALDQADKLAEMGGGMAPGGNAGSNPLSQINEMTDVFDFTVAGRDGGLVTLEARFSDEAAEKLGDDIPALPAGATIKLVIDEKSGEPRRMKMGDMIDFEFSNFTLLDEVDKGLFVFEKPDGVPVMDLTAMADQLGAGAP